MEPIGSLLSLVSDAVLAAKLRWNLSAGPVKRRVFQGPLSRFHVGLRESRLMRPFGLRIL